MSGRTKRIIYQFVDLVLWLAAIVGVVLMLRFGRPDKKFGVGEIVVCVMLVLAVFLRIPVLIHELGHLIFGWLAGFKAAAVSLGLVRISREGIRFNGYSNVAGATEMFPTSGKYMRVRFLAHTLGGGVFNLLAGGTLLTLYLCLPYHEALLFCGMLSLFSLYEGFRAFFPAQLRAGKTDGAIALGLLRRSSEEEVTLCILKAQGILFRGKFSDVPRELLFDTPVVREDTPEFFALYFLRMQYLLYHGEESEARKILIRLEELGEYLSETERGELMRYRSYFYGRFTAKKEPLSGINDLEEKLQKSSERTE